MSKGNPRITIRFTPDEMRKLAELAATNDTNMAAIVREAVQKLLTEHKK